MPLVETHANWIGGAWRAPERGSGYELAAATGEPLGRWPRSDAADVELALGAAREGGADWRAYSRGERLELLEDALSAELFLGDPGDLLARRLGALPEEVAPWVDEARRLGRRLRAAGRGQGSPPERDGAPPEPTTALLRVHGAALFPGLVERLWPLLADGWAVLLLADPTLPMLAEELALALDHAGLPLGALSLLSDDGASTLRAGLRAEGIGLARVLDHAERRAELEELAGRPRALPLPLRFEVLSTATWVVRAGDDPEQAAREVAARAVGRSEALSGQRSGQIGRVVCHQRLFSPFSGALLREIDRRAADEAGALALLEPDLPRHLGRLRRLGLDEGATLVRGDGALGGSQDGGGGRRRGSAGSRGHRGDARLSPLVFTNVEPGMRLSRIPRPAPVLRLLRAGDDAEALRRAEELDAAP